MRLTILLLPLAVSAGALGAQPAAPGAWQPPDSAAWERLSPRVGGARRVRVITRGVPVEVAGSAIGANGVRTPSGDSLLPWSDISRLQVRRSAFTKGLKIGAIVGGVGGLAVGLSSLRQCEGWFDMFCGADAGDVAGITIVSTIVYGLLGGLIAAPFGTWGTVYQARPAAPPPAAPLVAAVRRDWCGTSTILVGVRLRF
jgi:hypothetical protein